MRRVRVLDVIEHRAHPHELAPELHDLWRDGFHAGAARVRGRLARAESDADYWYLRATYTDAEIDAMHQAAIDAAFESGAIRWLDEPDPTASWADARTETSS